MSTRTARIAAIALTLLLSGIAVADAHDFTVLRGVDANTNTGKATLSPSQFIFTGPEGEKTLSTFDTKEHAYEAHNRKPCYAKITITGLPNEVPVKGDQGTITIGARTYDVVFDDDPPGHWSILPSGHSLEHGKTDFSNYAKEHKQFVNGYGLKEGKSCYY